MKRTCLVLAALLAEAGCSTLVEGTTQEIAINTVPPGAACSLERNGAHLGDVNPTPGKLKIDKTKYDISKIVDTQFDDVK